MEEIWKDIKDYESLYQVSSLGRVRSVDRLVDIHNSKRIAKGQIISQHITKSGYCVVDLYKGNERKALQVHRLVAEAFIPNPDNLPQVNHKSEAKTENFVENLEWCDQSYNVSYNGLSRKRGRLFRKPIIQMDLDGNEIFGWLSMRDCQYVTGYHRGCIADVCKGKYSQAYGYKWKYAN